MKNVCTQHLCMDNCQLNKKPKQQMFNSRDRKPRGDDNEVKPRKKITMKKKIHFEGGSPPLLSEERLEMPVCECRITITTSK